MLAFLTSARADLAAFHPAAPAVVLALIVGAVIYAWRKLHPTSFQKLPDSLQSLPAMVLSALVAALSSGDDGWRPVVDAIAGVFVGLIPIGGHHLLKAAPGRYLGGTWPAAGLDMKGAEKAMQAKLSSKRPGPPPMPPTAVVLAVALVLTGCPPSNPACSEADLVQIEASYQAELAGACYGFGEDCPDKPKIDAKYRRLREDWVRCSPPDHVEDAGQ